ncbi:MAG: hypothetical protein A2Y38_16260 [Spirochaetes bacterium GWB1_59_5]|nr:MAG: hypothetical protein A2Y38_16260 [Spirochaetes bacterium GWB1_59_5]
MSKYKRGPIIPDLETLIFCLQHGDHVYHETAILPACQLGTWTYNKLREKVRSGKLHFAEVKS